MYELFTDQARKVMQLANQEAQRFNHEYIATEHLLLALIKNGDAVFTRIMKFFDVDPRELRLSVEKIIQSGPDMVTMGRLPQTPRVKKVLDYAMDEARVQNAGYVGTAHILLGLLRETEGTAAQVLLNAGLKLEAVRQELGLPGEKEEQKPKLDDLIAMPTKEITCVALATVPMLRSLPFNEMLAELRKFNQASPVLGALIRERLAIELFNNV